MHSIPVWPPRGMLLLRSSCLSLKQPTKASRNYTDDRSVIKNCYEAQRVFELIQVIALILMATIRSRKFVESVLKVLPRTLRFDDI